MKTIVTCLNQAIDLSQIAHISEVKDPFWGDCKFYVTLLSGEKIKFSSFFPETTKTA